MFTYTPMAEPMAGQYNSKWSIFLAQMNIYTKGNMGCGEEYNDTCNSFHYTDTDSTGHVPGLLNEDFPSHAYSSIVSMA
jgi:hypothetical protein